MAQQRGTELVRIMFVGLAGISLTWLSVAVTLTMTMADAHPRLVLAAWSSAATAKTAAAWNIVQSLISAPSTPAKFAARRNEALNLAGGALAREPVLAEAASAFGAASILAGNEVRGDMAYGYAQRLSRRDVESQLWLIERAVRTGDIAGALTHYDIALRANPALGNTLLPVLAQASANRVVRIPLLRLLRRRPSWRSAYLKTMLATSLPATAVAEQLAGARLDAAENDTLTTGLTYLVQAKQYRLAVGLLPNVAAMGLRNGSFEQVPSLVPFDWQVSTEEDLLAYREPRTGGDGTYVLHIASKERGGLAARQLVALPSGRFSLAGIVGNDGTLGDATPLITISCADAQHALAILPLNSPPAEKRNFLLNFSIPGQGCEAQWIALSTPPDSTVDAWIDALRLRQTGSSAIGK